MADPHSSHQPHAQEPYDAELDLKSIIGFTVGLAGATIIALAVMWGMSTIFKQAEVTKDPPPSPMAEAMMDPIPPGPRLQSAPPRDMEEMRAQDREALSTYGWVDPAAGVVRIPVDRAMAIIAEKGLGPASDKKKEAK